MSSVGESALTSSRGRVFSMSSVGYESVMLDV
jgi:hypothetical protein